MELIETDLILSLDDIRALHAGELLRIPPGATVLVSQVWMDTIEAMPMDQWEAAVDRFNHAPRGGSHDSAC